MDEKKDSKKTSVVIPFYNNFDYIEQAVQSLQQQTVSVKEIIIVNDGPSEESRSFLERFSGVAKIVEHAANLGIAQARNTGVENATGEYIGFLDADDVWYADKLFLQEQLLSNDHTVSACHTGTAIFKHDLVAEEICINKPAKLTLRDCIIDSHVVPSTLLIRREIFITAGGFSLDIIAEDYDFWFVLLSKNHSIGFINQPLVWFRRANHGNESGKWQYILFGRLQVFKKHRNLIYKEGGITALANNLQRTFELAAWRANSPLSYIFRIISIILPKG